MDRIQKALDKAKAKHGETNTRPQALAKTVKSRQVEDPLKDGLEEINYKFTKVFNVSNEQLEARRVIAGIYNNSQSSIFRMLRTQVLTKMRENDWKTLAIVSPTSGEGKSLVSSNLAVAIAMELNQTVMLVDMDLRNPSVANYFSVPVEKGLKDYLEQDIELQNVLVNPGIKRLVILPGKDRAEDSAELLSSPKMASLVEDLKMQYDSRIIIFDVPPILQTDDVLLATKYFDCALLVLEDGKNKESDIRRANHLLSGTRLIGSVLNKSALAPTHQNY